MDFKSQLWGSGFPWLCVGRQWLWWFGGSSTSFHGGDSPQRCPVFWKRHGDFSDWRLVMYFALAGHDSGNSTIYTFWNIDALCTRGHFTSQVLTVSERSIIVARMRRSTNCFHRPRPIQYEESMARNGFSPVFMHISLWVCVRCCAPSESLLQICKPRRSFRICVLPK